MKVVKAIFKYLLIGTGIIIISSVVFLLAYYHLKYKKPVVASAENTSVQPVRAAATDSPLLVPVPRQLTWKQGSFHLPTQLKVQASSDDSPAIINMVKNRLPVSKSPLAATNGHLRFAKSEKLKDQGYHLSVQPAYISIEYKSLQGAFHALTTLKQLVTKDQSIPAVTIDDEPDLAVRGALIDISRGKVPKVETVYELVDLLADLKFNQLQLYVEGFSFGYPSFKQYWETTNTPLMPEEIQAIDRYCKERYIELVPNQNSLGHMQDWLKQPDLKDLAECPEGYKLLGLIEVKTTLSPTDPRSLDLVKKMSEDLLPNFSSNQFNVNLDEPFELGKSKQRPISDHRQIADLYLGYVNQLHGYVKTKDKQMMMWGDVISKTPEVISQIPKDITLLEWRYEAIQPFEEICAHYKEGGIRYMVCPGTSTWSSFTGRTDNMMANVSNAIESGIKYGAEGMLITDWGDTPHQQYLTVSFAGLTYAGALSWNYASKDDLRLSEFLSHRVFNDTSGTMGSLVLDLGRYNQFEEYPMLSMTTTNLALRLGMMDPVMLDAIGNKMQQGVIELSPFDSVTNSRVMNMFTHPKAYRSKSLLSYLSQMGEVLNHVSLDRPDSALILAEYRNAIRMIRASALLKHYNLFHLEESDEQNRTTLTEISTLCPIILSEHERVWMARNKSGGYEGSIETLKKLQSDAGKQLELLDANFVSRWGHRQLDKMIAAAAAVYLR
ncbi:glycoside hydrolase family 20 zincin-like fold domain-containing protein [Chryseolinea sp. T2]|uniref:beta-N-acetylhexosaminidase n=1 Tax=Chryseolinea sp. T2 TaxID=3129255 RepID=UPI0030768C9F